MQPQFPRGQLCQRWGALHTPPTPCQIQEAETFCGLISCPPPPRPTALPDVGSSWHHPATLQWLWGHLWERGWGGFEGAGVWRVMIQDLPLAAAGDLTGVQDGGGGGRMGLGVTSTPQMCPHCCQAPRWDNDEDRDGEGASPQSAQHPKKRGQVI